MKGFNNSFNYLLDRKHPFLFHNTYRKSVWSFLSDYSVPSSITLFDTDNTVTSALLGLQSTKNSIIRAEQSEIKGSIYLLSI